MTTNNQLPDAKATDSEIQMFIDSHEKGMAMFLRVESYYLMAKELQERRKADSSEPVGYTDAEELRSADNEIWMWKSPHGFGKDIPLYAALPAAVVPDDGREQFEAWMLEKWGRERQEYDFAMGKFLHGENYADSYTRHMWKAWSAGRAAMLQTIQKDGRDAE